MRESVSFSREDDVRLILVSVAGSEHQSDSQSLMARYSYRLEKLLHCMTLPRPFLFARGS